jgi:subtilisin family serine protease
MNPPGAAALSPTRSARELVRLPPLIDRTSGSADVVVGVIDGPVDVTHPDLAGARLGTAGCPTTAAGCDVRTSLACRHGTFITGMFAAGPQSAAPGMCPGCPVILRPIFCEAGPGRTCPVTTPADLAAAIADTVDAGAGVINLSVGVDAATSVRDDLPQALDYAAARGVLVVTAAGNQGHVGPVPMMSHPWPVPVAACDLRGRPLRLTNTGIAIGRTGLLAPGDDVFGLAPNGAHQRLTGTSTAVPFVSATAALLWSLQPSLSAARVRAALLQPTVRRHSIIPPLLDAVASARALFGT